MISDTEQEVGLSEDIVIGADAIAAFVRMTRRQVYSCAARGTMPIFKIGALVCARRLSILKWIETQESRPPVVTPIEGHPVDDQD